MTRRQQVGIAMLSALLLVAAVAFVAMRDDGGGDNTLSAGAGDGASTTTAASAPSEGETTTSASVPPPPTTSAVSRPTTRVSAPPPLAPTTATPKPLVLSEARVGVGAPCRDASTTTSSGDYAIDGCFFFVFWPLTERDVNVWLHSSRGYSGDVIGPPCQEHEGRCHAYIGPVYDRAVGERECFWLTTTDAGWTQKSSEVCMNWSPRP